MGIEATTRTATAAVQARRQVVAAETISTILAEVGDSFKSREADPLNGGSTFTFLLQISGFSSESDLNFPGRRLSDSDK